MMRKGSPATFLARFCMLKLLFLHLCSCAALDPSHVNLRTSSSGEWIVKSRITRDRCQIIERFSKPRFIEDVCMAKVSSTTSCLDGRRDLAPVEGNYIAIPYSSSCASLRVGRDFFPQSAFGGDSYFHEVLRQVAMELRIQANAPSPEIRYLGESAVRELLERQMSAMVDLQLEPTASDDVERYTATFYLPDSGDTVSLSIDIDGSDSEWALVLE